MSAIVDGTTLSTKQTTVKTLKSKHGKSLIRELSEKTGDINKIISFINEDPLAARYKDPESGENAFHILLQNGPNNEWRSNDVVMRILKLMIDVSPKGLEERNYNGAYYYI